MKKISLLLLIFLFFAAACGGNADQNTEKKETVKAEEKAVDEGLLIVTEAWPPYVYDENGEVKGFDYEVMMAVFERMGKKVNFKFFPWKRCIAMIKARTAVAILDASENKERLEYMIFPGEKLSDSNSVLFYVKGKQRPVRTLKDLTGKTVGISRGYSYSEAFDNATNFKKEAVDTFEQNAEKLINGRVDYFIYNRSVALFKIKGSKYDGKIVYVKKPITFGENHLAFSMMEGNKELAEQFEAELKKFKQTQEYKDIMAKYGQ